MPPHRRRDFAVAVGCLGSAGVRASAGAPAPPRGGTRSPALERETWAPQESSTSGRTGPFRVRASPGQRRMAQQAHDRPGAPAAAGPSSGGAQMARSTCFKATRPSTQCRHRLAQIGSSGSAGELLARLLATAARLATDPAVLHVHFPCVVLALVAAAPACLGAGLKERLRELGVARELPREGSAGHLADVGAVEVQVDASRQLLDALLAEASIGAGGHTPVRSRSRPRCSGRASRARTKAGSEMFRASAGRTASNAPLIESDLWMTVRIYGRSAHTHQLPRTSGSRARRPSASIRREAVPALEAAGYESAHGAAIIPPDRRFEA